MTTVTVIVIVVVLLALAAGAYVMAQNRRRAELQHRFGPEYDRQVAAADNRKEAEQHLAGVARKRDKLDVRDLDESERARYTAEWDAVQARFVDEPSAAVDSAEQLISTVMRERGYPVDDFDEQADLVAVDHPEVVSHYRDAHSAHERHRSAGGLDTEDLRQSFVHYRALFGALVGVDVPDPTPSSSRPVADPPVEAGPADAAPTSTDANTDESSTAPRSTAAEPTAATGTGAEAPVTDAEGRPVTDSHGETITDADLDRKHQETR